MLVQPLPSSQAAPSAFTPSTQAPLCGLHVEVWHWSEAGQTTGFVPVQTPAWQTSVCVHLSPSLHAVPFSAGGFEQTPVW